MNMSETALPSSGRLSRTKGVQACQYCHALKAKCQPTNEPRVCQRCLAAGRECTWGSTRQARKPRGPSRIFQVEQKLDGLIARFGNDNGSPQRQNSPDSLGEPALTGAFRSDGRDEKTRSSADPALLQAAKNPRTVQNIEPLHHLSNVHSFSNTDQSDSSFNPTGAFNSQGVEDNPSGEKLNVLKDIVSEHEAESLLNDYRLMVDSFPFVPIPENVSIRELHNKRPMLLLAILTAASWKDRVKQTLLCERYRHELSQRAIFQPRKSHSLIQSLLVHLAWYHFYFSHRSQNIVPLLHVLIGLVLDLGLHQKHKRSIIPSASRGLPSPSEEREEQRTLLGCFYLSAAITANFHKPNLFGHTKYMSECCRKLATDREYESDSILPSLIGVRLVDQGIYDNFHAEERLDQTFSSPGFLARLQSWKGKLENWRKGGQKLSSRLDTSLSYYYANMELHSVGLRREIGDDEDLIFNSSSNGYRLEALNDCLESAKCFLDTLIACPIGEYHLIAFVDWMRLPRIVMTICKLSFPSGSHPRQWDIKAANDRVRLDLYLDSLCYRMQTLRRFQVPDQNIPNFWWAMQKIMELIRDWYKRKPDSLGASALNSPKHSMTAFRGFSKNLQHTTLERSAVFTPADATSAGNVLETTNENSVCADAGNFRTSTPGADGLTSMDFDMEQFLDMDFWGGAGSYDPTIYESENIGIVDQESI